MKVMGPIPKLPRCINRFLPRSRSRVWVSFRACCFLLLTSPCWYSSIDEILQYSRTQQRIRTIFGKVDQFWLPILARPDQFLPRTNTFVTNNPSTHYPAYRNYTECPQRIPSYILDTQRWSFQLYSQMTGYAQSSVYLVTIIIIAIILLFLCM